MVERRRLSGDGCGIKMMYVGKVIINSIVNHGSLIKTVKKKISTERED